MASIYEEESLAGKRRNGRLDLFHRNASAQQLLHVCVVWEEEIFAALIVHAVAREQNHGDIVALRLLPEPIEPVENIIPIRAFVGKQLDLDVSIQSALLPLERCREVLRVFRSIVKLQRRVCIMAHADREHVQFGFVLGGFRVRAAPAQMNRRGGAR